MRALAFAPGRTFSAHFLNLHGRLATPLSRAQRQGARTRFCQCPFRGAVTGPFQRMCLPCCLPCTIDITKVSKKETKNEKIRGLNHSKPMIYSREKKLHSRKQTKPRYKKRSVLSTRLRSACGAMGWWSYLAGAGQRAGRNHMHAPESREFWSPIHERLAQRRLDNVE